MDHDQVAASPADGDYSELDEYGPAVSQDMLARVPPELWGEIFVRCIPSDSFIVPRTNEAPLSLAQVCHAWRDIALSYPRLWSSFRLVCGPSSLALAQTWIARSSDAPLSFDLVDGAYISNIHVGALCPVLVALLPQAHRWKHAQIFVNKPSTIALLNGVRAAPLLQTLDLTMDGPLVRDLTAFARAPSLTVARVVNLQALSYPLPASVGDFTFPWPQLTELTLMGGHNIGSPSPGQWLDILGQCGRLERCQMRVAGRMDVGIGPPVELPRLYYLQLFTNWLALPIFFSRLHHRNLHHLWIAKDSADVDSALPAALLRAFISRSATSLKELYLNGVPFGLPEDLIRLLRQTPYLSTLAIREAAEGTATIDDAVIAALTKRPQECLLPRLAALRLPHCRGGFKDATLLVMILSRLWSVPRAVANGPDASSLASADFDTLFAGGCGDPGLACMIRAQLSSGVEKGAEKAGVVSLSTVTVEIDERPCNEDLQAIVEQLNTLPGIDIFYEE